MSQSSLHMVRTFCERFSVYHNHDKRTAKKLLKLALQSYYMTPTKDRNDWTLEAIVKYGL